ncbi:hypothetical protein [Streptomyces tauricus]
MIMLVDVRSLAEGWRTVALCLRPATYEQQGLINTCATAAIGLRRRTETG